MATTSSIMPSASAPSTVAAKAPARATGFDSVLAPLTGAAQVAAAREPSAARPPGHTQPVRAPGKTLAAGSSPHSLALQAAGGSDGGSGAATQAPPAPSLAATPAVLPGLGSPNAAGAGNPAKIDGEPNPADTNGARCGAIAQDSRFPAGTEDAAADLPDEARLGQASGTPPGAAPSTADDAAADEPGARPPAAPKLGRTHKGSAGELPVSGMSSGPPDLAFSIGDDAGAPASVSPAGLDQVGPATASGAQATAGTDPAAPTPIADTAAAPPAQAAAQLGQALAAIHTGPDGSSHVRILLNPAELGSVQVNITRTHDGVSSVSVAVERPETLRTLQTDLGHLHQALDRAGLSDQRSVTLHLAAPETGRDASSGPGGFGGNGAAWGGSQQGQQGTRQERQYDKAMPALAHTAQIDSDPRWTPATWRRAGVNITA